MERAPDPFAGREREMAQLGAALEDAIAGRGRIVMLVGEPGIGKTRTAEELARVAVAREVEVLWGRCREEPGAPPLWPWRQAIEAHVETTSEDALRLELGAGMPVIAEVIPAVREKPSGVEPASPPGDPEAARFRLFDALASYLKRAARSRPILLLLDDLHRADAASVRFLEFIAPDLDSVPILVVGTYRDVEIARRSPLARTLGELVRQRSYTKIVLHGIDIDATAQLVRKKRAGCPTSPQIGSQRSRAGPKAILSSLQRWFVSCPDSPDTVWSAPPPIRSSRAHGCLME